MHRILLPLVALFFTSLPAIAQVEGYYRHPDIHGDQITFSAEGDIWTVSSDGGSAVRLTSNVAEESYPVFSPDGTRIAFTGAYEGSPDVYVISAQGGTPKRITWQARGNARPVGWVADGRVLVRASWSAGVPDFRLALVHPETGDVEEVPLSQAAEGSYTADGSLVFARMPRQGSNSRFYKGGSAQQLWRFDGAGMEAVPLTRDYPGTSRQPNVLSDGKVYFLTDRQDGMNVWSMTPDGSNLAQHTRYSDFDIQELASDGNQLIYRLGADLYTMTPGEAPSRVAIRLVSDIEQSLTDWETSPFNWVSDADLSHDGSTVALVSRGELFTAPVGSGRWAHISRNSAVRYRNVVFTTDSLSVFALSDRSGELEWWKVRVDGTASPEQVTDGPAMLRQDAMPSPDGRYLTHGDYDNALWLVDLQTGDSEQLTAGPSGNPVAWTPDSKQVVYARSDRNMLAVLWVYDLEAKTHTQVTSNRFNDFSPHISADGEWLYFVSTRTWNSSVGSPWGERAPMPHFEDRAKVYAMPLKDGATFPFAEPDELKRSESDSDLRWDRADALREVPIPAGSMSIVGLTKDRLLYTEERDLKGIALKHGADPVTIAEGVSSVQLAGSREKVMLRKGTAFHVIPASSGAGTKLNDENQVHLDDWEFAVNKRDEWNQIYMDMWRLHRDYFWDPNMGGVDWEAMREKYAPLLPRVGSRQALADLQGMLVSKLSLLHSNAGGGDVRDLDNRAAPADLGGRFVRDEATGGFRLVHRLKYDPDLLEYRGPLANPDADIVEGSVILAVNGQSTSDAPALGALLMNQAGKQVRLRVQDPDGSQRDAIVTPITGGQTYDLQYHEWEYTRRLEAERMSQGNVGYLHLRAMGRGDAGQFTREFYSQLDKQAIIIDVRHNNGGNIDSWVLTQLMRRPWAWFKPRGEYTYPNMQFSFGGHLVILVDERSASDGEAVADGFRRLGLGATIGVRTWGGEVWLSGSNRQVDNGVTRASETGVFADGEWLIEGWGFVPDMEVDNPPHATYNGHDAQLEAAVVHLMQLIESDPRMWPEPPPYPELIPGYGFPTPWNRN